MSKHVLIADDEPNIVISLEFLMKREGFTVLVATDGEAALAQTSAHKPDLVLLDVMLPKKNGFEVCQQIRATPEWQGIKVITLLLRVASPDVRSRWILPVLRSWPVKLVSHPLVAWLLFTAVMWGRHVSPLFDAALEDPIVHDLEHGLYLASAMLFWWPVVARDPSPWRLPYPARIGYLFLQMPLNSLLGVAILLTGQGLQATLLPVRANLEDFATLSIGLMGGCRSRFWKPSEVKVCW